MLKTYFKIAWRNLLRNKSFTFINIGGLAIGMASALLMLLWIQHELSMDRFHLKKDRIFKVWNRAEHNGEIGVWDITPQPLGPKLQDEFPEVVRMSRLSYIDEILFTTDNQKITSSGAFVDTDFLDMFDFPLISGDLQSVFLKPTDIVVTAEFARRLFVEEPAMGKTILVDNSYEFTVTGVLKDLPNNTQFAFDYLVSWSLMEMMGWADDFWGNNSVGNYVELVEGVDLPAFQEKIRDIRIRHSGDGDNTEVFLHAMPDWWLYSKFENGKIAGGRIEMVRLFGIIAGFILLIACINFMNLSTARSEKRAKEVGIRKVVGARKFILIKQFLMESILIAFIAGIFGLIFVELVLPHFNELAEKSLAVDYQDPIFLLGFLVFSMFTGFLAGSYPAFFLSSFQPVKVLKGTFNKVNYSVNPRKILVVLQFTIAIVLIVSTLVINMQLQHGKNRENGYDKNNLVYLSLTDDIRKNYGVIRNELLGAGVVTSMTQTLSPLTEVWSSTNGIEWEGKPEDDRTNFERFNVDQDIVTTAGLTIVAGRDMDLEKFPSDSAAVLINETAVKQMGFEAPLGQVIRDSGFDWHVVGVVKDFIIGSPFSSVNPMILEGTRGVHFWTNVVHMKFNPDLPTIEALAKTEDLLKKYNPDYPFEYTFVDEAYARKFKESQRSGQMATLFAFLTIFISCLGLLGLSAFIAESRTKEIGIRKILGSSVASLTALLSRDFLILVSISCLIAFPIAYWAMDNFLQSFAYRIDLNWWVFALAGVGTMLIALLTVSSQAIRTALANPVESLRSE